MLKRKIVGAKDYILNHWEDDRPTRASWVFSLSCVANPTGVVSWPGESGICRSRWTTNCATEGHGTSAKVASSAGDGEARRSTLFILHGGWMGVEDSFFDHGTFALSYGEGLREGVVLPLVSSTMPSDSTSSSEGDGD